MQRVALDTFAAGNYYWTVRAIAPESPAFTQKIGPLAAELFTLRHLQPIRLRSPAAGMNLPGLNALRQQITFSWDSTERIGRSRFILSQSPNPAQGRPEKVILNPGRTIAIEPNTLSPGLWYWTIEAQSPEGFDISAGAPRQLRVLPIPLLTAALNRLPANGHRFEDAELSAHRRIYFSWSAVGGANAYIFSLFQETENGLRQINLANAGLTGPLAMTNWTLEDLSVLDKGTFIWKVEAISRNRTGVIEQRGQIGENIFTVFFQTPGRVELDGPRSFYGE
jgi:hypothetical protein